MKKNNIKNAILTTLIAILSVFGVSQQGEVADLRDQVSTYEQGEETAICVDRAWNAYYEGWRNACLNIDEGAACDLPLELSDPLDTKLLEEYELCKK
jgi:hypothetical protein